MTNPLLVEILRGERVESSHRGAVAVFDGDGKAVLRIGDTKTPVFPRSAVKSIQALPLVESGAADAYGFGDEELALACASHSGEPDHVALVSRMLAKAGLGPSALECGTHWPLSQEADHQLARSGETPSALHNNCSGKHTGFVCTCGHLGIDHRGYVGPDHEAQEMVREAMEVLTGHQHDDSLRGVDGCSIPTYAVPLEALALAFARMATGRGLATERAAAAKRILAACMAKPFFTAGTGRADTRIMETGAGRIFVKTGAEGVYCGAVPELGLGIALKCDDGATRASEVMVAAVLAKLLADDAELSGKLASLSRPDITNWNRIVVGEMRSVGELSVKGC